MSENHLPVRVLLVEDDTDIRDAIQQLLEDRGFEVAGAANGAEGLAALRRGHPADVILLDLMMPVMDGPQFRAAQQADPVLATIPVVVISADANGARRARDLGAAAFLQKPIDIDALVGAVDRARG